MDISTIKTIACFVPAQKDDDQIINPSSFATHNLVHTKKQDKYELELIDDFDVVRQSWEINDCIVPSSPDDESENLNDLVDLAVKGFDVACLSISVHTGLHAPVHFRKRQDLQKILNLLKAKLDASYKIEFGIIAAADGRYYDIRKDMVRPQDRLIKKGMDSILRQVESVDDIWKILDLGSRDATILTIRLTNQEKQTQGRLQCFDLLYPQFNPACFSTFYSAKSAFSTLRAFVDYIKHPNIGAPVDMSSHLFTNELSKYLCGHNKLVAFAYLNEDLVDRIHLNETVACLDFISNLTDIPTRSFINQPVFELEKYQALKISNEELWTKYSNLFKEHAYAARKIEIMHNSRENADKQEMINLTEKYNYTEAMLKIKINEVIYLRKATEPKKIFSEYDLLEKQAEIVKLKMALDLKDFMIEDIQLATDQDSKEKHILIEERSEIENKTLALQQEVSRSYKMITALNEQMEAQQAAFKEQTEAQQVEIGKLTERLENAEVQWDRYQRQCMAVTDEAQEKLKEQQRSQAKFNELQAELKETQAELEESQKMLRTVKKQKISFELALESLQEETAYKIELYKELIKSVRKEADVRVQEKSQLEKKYANYLSRPEEPDDTEEPKKRKHIVSEDEGENSANDVPRQREIKQVKRPRRVVSEEDTDDEPMDLKRNHVDQEKSSNYVPPHAKKDVKKEFIKPKRIISKDDTGEDALEDNRKESSVTPKGKPKKRSFTVEPLDLENNLIDQEKSAKYVPPQARKDVKEEFTKPKRIISKDDTGDDALEDNRKESSVKPIDKPKKRGFTVDSMDAINDHVDKEQYVPLEAKKEVKEQVKRRQRMISKDDTDEDELEENSATPKRPVIQIESMDVNNVDIETKANMVTETPSPKLTYLESIKDQLNLNFGSTKKAEPAPVATKRVYPSRVAATASKNADPAPIANTTATKKAEPALVATKRVYPSRVAATAATKKATTTTTKKADPVPAPTTITQSSQTSVGGVPKKRRKLGNNTQSRNMMSHLEDMDGHGIISPISSFLRKQDKNVGETKR